MRSTLFRSQHVGDFARARPNRAIGQRAPSSFQGEGDQANLPLEPSFGLTLLQAWCATPRAADDLGVLREIRRGEPRACPTRSPRSRPTHCTTRPDASSWPSAPTAQASAHRDAAVLPPTIRAWWFSIAHRARYEIRVRAGGKVAPEIVMQTLRPIQITVKNSPPRILRRILLGGI